MEEFCLTLSPAKKRASFSSCKPHRLGYNAAESPMRRMPMPNLPDCLLLQVVLPEFPFPTELCTH
jgi:hypothetical protein